MFSVRVAVLPFIALHGELRVHCHVHQRELEYGLLNLGSETGGTKAIWW